MSDKPYKAKAIMDAVREKRAQNKAVKTAAFLDLFVPQIIAYQDDVTPEEGVAFYKAFDDPLHTDCLHNNCKMCPKCRVSDAEQLAMILISSMESEKL